MALSARSADKLAAVAGGHPRARLAPLDFTDGAAVRRGVGDAARKLGRLRPGARLAGTHREVRAWELDEADANALLQTNLNAPIATVAAVVPGLLAQGHGAIGPPPASPATAGCPRR